MSPQNLKQDSDMKIMKFGGSSVGTPESLSNVKSIIERRGECAVVVVSALGGVTDLLVSTARLAERGDESYRDSLSALRKRHLEMCSACIADAPARDDAGRRIEELADRLERICQGVRLLGVLPRKTLDEILSHLDS